MHEGSEERPTNTATRSKHTKHLARVRNLGSSTTVDQYLSRHGCMGNRDSVSGHSFGDHSIAGPVSSQKQNYSPAGYAHPQKSQKLNAVGCWPYVNHTLAMPPCLTQGFQNFKFQPLDEIALSELDFLLPGESVVTPRCSSLRGEAQAVRTANTSAGAAAVSDASISATAAYRSDNATPGQSPMNSISLPPCHMQDHIIAERRRREKLSQHFVALSAVIPTLKKIDRASLLGEAVKYIKQTQKRIQDLEEHIAMRAPVDAANTEQVSRLCQCSLTKWAFESQDGQHSEIELRVIDRNMLIRVQCPKTKGVLLKALSEIEKLHLRVVNANTLPFAGATVILTFDAQVEEGCSMAVDDIVKELKNFFLRLV